MEKYEELKMEVVVFEEEDVILTSGGDDAGPLVGKMDWEKA